MSKRIFSEILVSFLLISMLTCGFRIQPVKAQPTTIIVPDDFSTIQAAIDAASHGDTVFVRNGTYSGPIVIDKPLILHGESRETTIINRGSSYNEPSGSVVGVFSDNVQISNFTIQHYPLPGGCAVSLNGYVNMTFSDNIITGPYGGVSILNSSGNIISNNSIQGCYGMVHQEPCTALGLNWTYGNTVYGNNISNNNVGIGGNFWNSTFFNNTIQDNSGQWAYWGISDNFSGCVFYHNNIIDNGQQVYNTNSNSNMWDNGYPSGGNYWSDYTGTDAYSGPYQNLTGSDGIGDTPYTIDANNTDNYPSMNPYTTNSLSITILPAYSTARASFHQPSS